GAVDEEGIDEGALHLEGRLEESVAEKGVRVARAVAALRAQRPLQGQRALAAAHRGPGATADLADLDRPVGGGVALMAGQGRHGRVGPGPRSTEPEDVSHREIRVIVGRAGEDRLEEILVFSPEAEIGAVE